MEVVFRVKKSTVKRKDKIVFSVSTEAYASGFNQCHLIFEYDVLHAPNSKTINITIVGHVLLFDSEAKISLNCTAFISRTVPGIVV